MNKIDRIRKLGKLTKSNWDNSSYRHIPHTRAISAKDSLWNTSTHPYDGFALTFLHDAESEIKDDYTIRRRIRWGLILGLTLYFIFIGFIVYYCIFYKRNNTLNIILSGGFISSFIGLLIIVFKYAFTSSNKYYDFVENIMHWAYEQHKND